MNFDASSLVAYAKTVKVGDGAEQGSQIGQINNKMQDETEAYDTVSGTGASFVGAGFSMFRKVLNGAALAVGTRVGGGVAAFGGNVTVTARIYADPNSEQSRKQTNFYARNMGRNGYYNPYNDR